MTDIKSPEMVIFTWLTQWSSVSDPTITPLRREEWEEEEEAEEEEEEDLRSDWKNKKKTG